jgi:hypothetical protein
MQRPPEVNGIVGSRDDIQSWVWGSHMLQEDQGRRFQQGESKWTLLFVWKDSEHKFNAIRIYAHNVGETVFKTFYKTPEKL